MSMWRPTINEDKYKQVILFLLNSAAYNALLGKVKLFKLLYYIDFDHYQHYKTSVTGDVYHKWPYGPVGDKTEQILSEMESEEMISITRRQVGDFSQYVFETFAQPADAFSSSEMEVLKLVVKKWANHTTNEIIAATHGEAPWRAVEMWDEIPYSLAFYRKQIGEKDADEELTMASTG
jgi:uncharacterized phage-associated protein